VPKQSPGPSPGSRRRLDAELVYDTGTQSLPRGLRAVGTRSRCLFLTAEEFEVMLEVQPDSSPEHRALTGSVMREGLPLEGALVRLDGPLAQTLPATDADGAFRGSGLPRGDYAVEIEDGEYVIVLPALSLEAA
jgi:hypothetical protein